MKHADLNSGSIETSRRRPLQQVFSLTLAVLLLAGCGGATATPRPTSTTGIITGVVLDDDGTPLENIYDQETLIVALFCSSDDADIECLQGDFWDMDWDVLFDSICEANDTASSCLLHLGQGAASVEADGSYTIAGVPPGQYGLVLMFTGPIMHKVSLKRDVPPVQGGQTIEYDIATELHRD